jgi:hypothetical protein
VVAACLVALLGFCLPQEIPLEYWPLSEPSNGQLYLQFKARFEVAGAYYRSEDFAGNHWWKPKTVTVMADALESPNGSKSADILQAGRDAYEILTAQRIPKRDDETFTFSIHVKKQNHRYVGLILGMARRSGFPFVDLDTGECVVPADLPYRMQATAVAHGWWRLSISGRAPRSAPGASGLVGCVLVDSAGKVGRVLTGTETLAVWGAQVEEGLVLSPYYPSGLSAPDHQGARFRFSPDFGRGYLAVEQIVVPISHTYQSLTYTLPLLDAPLCGLRVSPVDRPGTLWFEDVRLIDRAERDVYRFSLKDLKPGVGVNFVASTQGALGLSAPTLPSAGEIGLRLPHPLVPAGMNGRNFQRCFRSWAYLAGMLALILGCVAWLAGRRPTRRQGLRLVAFVLLLSALFSAVAQRGLMRNSVQAAWQATLIKR